MAIKQSPYSGERDWPAVAELIASDTNFCHRTDFSWRLCSTSLEDPQNAAVWEDETGAIKIFAALQFPWLNLDYAIHPDIRNWDIETRVIQWGETRLRQIAQETSSQFPFNIGVFAHEHERMRFLEDHGYARWEHHMVVLSRSLTELPAPEIPTGFMIRPLAGEAEVEAYAALQRAAFDSTNMTAAWRGRTLRSPLYNPDLDLVAVAPDGRLVGFCIWWFDPKSGIAQIEPLGVHPDFQRLGLSQALMLEGLRRVTAHGAKTARVETYSFSEPALAAYKAAGFEEKTQEFKYYKEY